MKKLIAVVAMVMAMGFIVQANESAEKCVAVEKSCKIDLEEALAKVNEAIEKRTVDLKQATEKGHTDAVTAIKKLLADLNAMKVAIEKKDKEAFKNAHKQIESDRKALEELRKKHIQGKKQKERNEENISNNSRQGQR